MDLRGWGVRVVAVGAVVAVLAGCSGEAEPVVTPTPSPTLTETVVESPSPTPSPTPTALTAEEVLAALPDDIQQEDLGGAFSFASSFLKESRGIFVSSDPRLFQAMSSEGCSFCRNVMDHFNEISLAGHSFDGGQIEVVSTSPQGGLQGDGTWHLEFEIAIDSSVVKDSAGAVVSETNRESHIVAVVLERIGDRYQVIDVGSERV